MRTSGKWAEEKGRQGAIALLCSLSPLLLLLAIAAPKARVEQRPAPRIDVFLHSSNAANADKLLKDLDRELRKASKRDDKRNRDLDLRTNGAANLALSGTVFLSDTNEADAFLETIRALAKPTQTSGRIVIHHCPDEEDPDYRDWSGCIDDPRASYREVVFP